MEAPSYIIQRYEKPTKPIYVCLNIDKRIKVMYVFGDISPLSLKIQLHCKSE